MRNGNERKSFSSSPLDFEVGLGLKMQPMSSYSCDGGGGGGGVPFLNASSTSQHPYYELANGMLVQRSLDNAASRPSGGMNMNMNMNMMGVGGKGVFTSSQLQELERQKMIHKYILASIPVPPQLLLSSSLSQCNTTLGSGMEMRYGSTAAGAGTNGFGSGSGSGDPEPWRCKRTDGKKWRCSRDVAGDQKYCERHAHKNRPRSRKHVEQQQQQQQISPHKPPNSLLPSSTLPLPPQQRSSSSSQFPYDQTRCIEWLMRGGNCNSDNSNPLSLCNNSNNNNNNKQQWEQMMSSSKNDSNNLSSVYHPQFAEKETSFMNNNSDTTQTTRLFIDSWGKEGGGVGNISKGMSVSVSASSPSSLSLSMSSRMGEGSDDDLGIGMMNYHHNQWLNPISWMNLSSSSSSSSSTSVGGGAAPGGPLGEALCLGNGGANLASPHHSYSHSHSSHGYANTSNSNSNTNSSKSSCEDASHALNFIG